MTVKELMEQLAIMPPEVTVLLEKGTKEDKTEIFEIEAVSFQNGNDQLVIIEIQ